MTVEELKEKEISLRRICNEMFDSGELTMYPKYPIVTPTNELERLIIN